MRASERLFGLFSDKPDLTPISDADSWATLKVEAARHGVDGLLAFMARPHVAGGERAWCDDVLKRNWIAHDRNLRRLMHLVGKLEAAGIRVVSLKGPVLACRYYTPPFLRKTSGDLDLALDERDLETACAVLIREGYAVRDPLRSTLRLKHHAVMLHSSWPKLELHFRISHGARGIPSAELLSRSIRYTTPGGGEVSILGPADELMQLILHVVHDRFAILFHLQELHTIWKAARPDVRAEALGRAVSYGFSGVVALTDAAFRSRWGQTLLPGSFQLPRTWMQWRLDEKFYRRMEARSEVKYDRTFVGRWTGRWSDLQIADSPKAALEVAVNAAGTALQRVASGLRIGNVGGGAHPG